jgi:hypothetical protein
MLGLGSARYVKEARTVAQHLAGAAGTTQLHNKILQEWNGCFCFVQYGVVEQFMLH